MILKEHKNGFTLAELMVATVIGAFIAFSAVGVMRAVSTSREKLGQSIEDWSQVRFAANMIRTDLANFYRDRNVNDVKLVGIVEPSDSGPASILTFYTTNTVKARIDEPEGDVYEVEYKLVRDEGKSVLLRRLWPNPDKNSEPGGMLTQIAENITIFDIQYFDGDEWFNEWPEESPTLPELIGFNLAAGSGEQKKAVAMPFIVSMARMPRALDTGSGVQTEQESNQSR